MDCKICNREFKNNRAIASHLNTHNLSLIEYLIQYEGFEVPKCSFCGKERKHRNGLLFHRTCCDKECITKEMKSRKLTEDHKRKIGHSLSKTLRNNPELITNNFLFKESRAEKYFKEVFEKENIPFKQEVKVHIYSLDFVLFDKKIDFEVDGEQHYSDDKIIESDKRRTKYLEDKGWKIIRVRWSEWCKLDRNEKEQFVSDLKQQKENIEVEGYYKPKKRKKKNLIEENKKLKVERRRILNESNIDLMKFGWVKKVSQLWNVSHTQVKRYIKNNYPDLDYCERSKCKY